MVLHLGHGAGAVGVGGVHLAKGGLIEPPPPRSGADLDRERIPLRSDEPDVRVGKAGFEPAASASRTPPERLFTSSGDLFRLVRGQIWISAISDERERMCDKCAMTHSPAPDRGGPELRATPPPGALPAPSRQPHRRSPALHGPGRDPLHFLDRCRREPEHNQFLPLAPGPRSGAIHLRERQRLPAFRRPRRRPESFRRTLQRKRGKVGALRSSAWIWGFSSTAKTAAATGGSRS